MPAVAVDGSTLFANYLGYVFALDLTSGKMLWRSASFHQPRGRWRCRTRPGCSTPTRFAIVAAGEHVWTLGRDLKDQNMIGPVPADLPAGRRGRVVWQSTDLPDYAQLDLVGPPILADGKLFIAAKSQAESSSSSRASRSSSSWRSSPTTASCSGRPRSACSGRASEYFYYGMRDTSPQPRLVYRAGAIYVDTHVGVLARLDAESGALDWGYGYKTDPFQAPISVLLLLRMQQEPTAAGGPPLQSGEALLVKGAQSDRLYAVDPNRMKVLWDRPIAKSSRLLGVDDRAVFLGGAEIERARPEDAEAPVGDARCRAAAWTGASWCGPTGSGNSRRGGSSRSIPKSGDGPADLPRRRPGLGRRRPVPDRSLAAGRLQSHDLRLSSPGDRGREAPPAATPATTKERASNE